MSSATDNAWTGAEMLCREHMPDTVDQAAVSDCVRGTLAAKPMGKAYDVAAAFCAQQCSDATSASACDAQCFPQMYDMIVTKVKSA